MDQNSSRKLYQPFVKYRNISIAIFVVIVVCSILFFRGRMAPGIYVASRDDQLELNCYDAHPMSIPYSDIRRLSLRESFDAGAMVDGIEDDKVRYGAWRNDQLGDYTLYGLKAIDHYVIVMTDDQAVAFNYESASVTDAIFTSIQTVLDQKGISYEVD